MSKEGRKREQYDLEERLIDYSARIIKMCDGLPTTKAGNHVCSQILRSGTSPAPNYGESQSAESRADFIHKLKVALKELRETRVWLKVIVRSGLIKPAEQLAPLLKETDELIAILFTSVETAKKNQKK
jgi:four helix bundle protein